jgi:hypothetical protein
MQLKRSWLAALMLMVLALTMKGAPALTTIEDTIWLADGKRFNGLLLIEWKSFQTQGGRLVTRATRSIRVVNGNLKVQLAPTTAQTPAAWYSVRYHANDRVMFTEVWSVAPSSRPLRLNQVKAQLSAGGVITQNPLPPPELLSGVFQDNDIPAGTIDGVNAAFLLTDTPNPVESLGLYRNGVLLSATVDYTLNGRNITFLNGAIPQAGDLLRASYRTGPIEAGTSLPPGFVSGSLLFAGPTGDFAQNNSALYWNNTAFQLGVGTSQVAATLHVADTNTGGATQVRVQAGPSQASTPLQRWTDAGSNDVARLDADGVFFSQRLRSASNATNAAYRDSGSSSDPTARANGDAWLNTTVQSRKTIEAGQVHTTPQVLCSASGSIAISMAWVKMGSCAIPANFLQPGDRLEVRFTNSRVGDAVAGEMELRLDTNVVLNRTIPANAPLFVGTFSAAVSDSSFLWGGQSWGAPMANESVVLEQNATISAATEIAIYGRMTAATADFIRLRNITIVRFPSQSNP